MQSWLLTIMAIRKIAETREVCTWMIEPVEGEIEIFIKPCVALVRKTQTLHDKKAFSDEFLTGIQAAPDTERLRFINLVVDCYSDSVI